MLELTKVDSVSGSLSVRNGAVVRGNIRGDKQSRIKILGYTADIYTANPEYYGEFVLDSAIGRLEEQNSLQNALAIVSKNSSLYFNSASASFRETSILEVWPTSGLFKMQVMFSFLEVKIKYLI